MSSTRKQVIAEHTIRRFEDDLSCGYGRLNLRAPQLCELGAEQLEPTPRDAGGLLLGCPA